MARRFIVSDTDIKYLDENNIIIQGKEVKHIQVLRHNIDDEIVVNNGVYKIKEMKRESISLEYINKAEELGVPNSNLTLFIALLKNDKLDFVVQKAVELGVKNIVPFVSNNVIVKLDDKNRQKRVEKLNKIALEACKQCGRTDYVEVEDIIQFAKLKDKLKEKHRVLFAYECSKDSLKNELKEIKECNILDVGIIIGAEGGFTSKEADELKEIENVRCVSLGERILRAETAALSLISVVMYEMEEEL